MNQTPPAGRRRKLDSAAKPKPPQSPSRKRVSRRLGAAGRWLNQPLAGLPGSSGSNPVVASLSRQRPLAPRYLRQAWGEMRQVTWPRFGQAMRLTASVAIFAFFFAVLVYAVDWVLTDIFRVIILDEPSEISRFLRELF